MIQQLNCKILLAILILTVSSMSFLLVFWPMLQMSEEFESKDHSPNGPSGSLDSHTELVKFEYATSSKYSTEEHFDIIFRKAHPNGRRSETIYAKKGDSVYCFATSSDGTLLPKLIPGIHAHSATVISENVIKDESLLYQIGYCGHIDQNSPDFRVYRNIYDIGTFQMALEFSDEGSMGLFMDKRYVYISVPQEFIIHSIDIDRASFLSLGYGGSQLLSGPEGVQFFAKNFYFKDKNGVYMLSGYGELLKLSDDKNFDIYQYESQRH